MVREEMVREEMVGIEAMECMLLAVLVERFQLLCHGDMK